MSAWEGSKMQERWEEEEKYKEFDAERKRRMEELSQRLAPKWIIVTSPDDFPKTQHWAIIKYPDSNLTNTVEYVAYYNRTDWVNEISELEAEGVRQYTAVEVKPATVTRTIAVEV